MASDALVTNELSRRFGQRVALDSLSIRVRRGEIYGFLGPNGAGKTTAIRCILGLIRADSGTTSVFGESDPVQRLRHIGAVVETPAFHPFLSGREALELSARYGGISVHSVDEALDWVGLSERSHDRVSTYSLGMRQRLGLARALLGRPPLLVLDEPTNGMDPRGMADVRNRLLTMAADHGTTVFISSHLLSEVEKLCDRVGILHHGRLVAECAVDADVESTYLAATEASR